MVNIRLSELRNQRGLSQAHVAQILNITHQAYSHYETGKRQMNYETLHILADLYDVSIDYILGRENKMPSFLSEDERELISRYRELDERAKNAVKNCMDFEYLQCSSQIEKPENAAM